MRDATQCYNLYLLLQLFSQLVSQQVLVLVSEIAVYLTVFKQRQTLRQAVLDSCCSLKKLQTSLASRLHVRLDFNFLRNELHRAALSKWYVSLFGATLKDFEFRLHSFFGLVDVAKK